MIDRRRLLELGCLGAGGMLFAPMAGPRVGFLHAATERRFVFILQRGAADGLNIVVPYADPAYARLRGNLAIDPASAHKLDGTFALHPALTATASMFAFKSAAFVHAVASPYRDRSHFDGQNVLETGSDTPYSMQSGWMNRLVGLLPPDGRKAIAISAEIPMALRGANTVASYAPSGLPAPDGDVLKGLAQLYAADPQLAPVWNAAQGVLALAERDPGAQGPVGLGKLAARFLRDPAGPRLAMLETVGWDTHSSQQSRLAKQLTSLDAMLAALREGLGPVWADTVILVATEFGRTAAANGTGGTDHGTASASWVLGGAVAGGQVVADWPGLGTGQLYQGRDLQPTIELDGLIAGVAAECLRLDPEQVARTLFPTSKGLKPYTGLVRN